MFIDSIELKGLNLQRIGDVKLVVHGNLFTRSPAYRW